MSCHGETHHAETEKSDFSHVSNLGFLPALEKPDRVLERGGGLVRCSKQVPLEMWNGHNKPCAMKGNSLRLAEEAGFARLNLRDQGFQEKGSDIA
jgi:hypothetical protein